MDLNTSNIQTKKPVAIVAQFGGETPVINRSLIGATTELIARGFRVLGPNDGADGILGIADAPGKNGKIEKVRRYPLGNYVEFNLLSDDELIRVSKRPGSFLGTSKFHIDDKTSPAIVEALKAKDCHYFFMIGGDSTAKIGQDILKAAERANYELKIGHIPKTIDNDLAVTDFSPGFGSAALAVCDRVFALKTSSDSQSGGLFITVTMGRNSGFLAGASGLSPFGPGTGADLIYLPEKNFVEYNFINDVSNILHNHRGQAVVVVSEGIRQEWKDAKGGYKLVSEVAADKANRILQNEGNIEEKRMSDAHFMLIDYLKNLVQPIVPDLKIRGETIGYSVRSGTMTSLVDLRVAFASGRQSVIFRLDPKNDGMPGISTVIKRIGQSHSFAVTFSQVPLSGVAVPGIQMPDYYIDTYGKGITDYFLEYAGVLLGPIDGYQSKYLLPSKWNSDGFIYMVE